jgi:hypothetical protein
MIDRESAAAASLVLNDSKSSIDNDEEVEHPANAAGI